MTVPQVSIDRVRSFLPDHVRDAFTDAEIARRYESLGPRHPAIVARSLERSWGLPPTRAATRQKDVGTG